MELEDRTDLTRFLLEFRKMVDLAFEEYREWFPEALVEPLQKAWSDLEPRFDQVVTAIDSGEYDQLLDAEGLSGEQLRAKRALWDAVRTAFNNKRRRRSWWDRIFGWSGGLLRLFKISMGVANTILESLGKVITPVGAIKEFKGVFEGALSLGEEAGGPVRRLVRKIFKRRRPPDRATSSGASRTREN